ncbi:MAG: hypothetical protein L6Q92_07845 [Phycisphaerae bacterium]|nr:hypothetical protein [Phycisphaerae bacterium]
MQSVSTFLDNLLKLGTLFDQVLGLVSEVINLVSSLLLPILQGLAPPTV